VPIKGLSFSKSGKELVVTECEHWGSTPEVISLESYVIFQSAVAESPILPGIPGQNRSGTSSEQALQLRDSTLSSLGILTEATSKGVSQKVEVAREERTIKVNFNSNVGTVAEVELLNLPDWDYLENTVSTVIGPKTREEKINIILEAAAEPWYDISDKKRADKSYLPLLIQKEQRAVKVQIMGEATEGRVRKLIKPKQ
jgi:hypothetical protein